MKLFALLSLTLFALPVSGRIGDQNRKLKASEMFVVEFEEDENDLDTRAQRVADEMGGTVKYVYRNALKGALIEAGGGVTVNARSRGNTNTVHQHKISSDVPLQGAAVQVQMDAPKGLDRIDQTELPLNRQYKYAWDGSGVEIYVLDSGVRSSHHEFEGRPPKCGFNAITFNHDDCHDGTGHGSHVAGVAAGQKYGVAKKATLIPVKVLNDNGDGSMGSMIAGIDFVISEKKKRPDQPMIINLSIVGNEHRLANQAVDRAHDAGIVVVVAAGNKGKKACDYSPASASKAITVGSSEDFSFLWWNFERKAMYSNWGGCVDIHAPGTKIISADTTGDDDADERTGTSMASPHVAGAVALYLQRDPSLSPSQVRQQLIDDAAKGKLFWLFQWFTANRQVSTSRIN